MINTKNENYSLCKKIPIVLPKSISEHIDNKINIPDFYFEKIKKSLISAIPEEEIHKRLANLTSLTLELTQKCNLFCKYCAYSGIYKSRRVHQNRKMALSIAKKSVDLFFKQITSPIRFSRKNPLISFYGGEPLLEFENVIEVVKYVKYLNRKNDIEVNILITTNGVLLTKEKIKFLVNENIKIDISLDGPEREHNRFRLKANGNGSFSDVFNNIKYIKNNYPGYFAENVKFKITLHPEHDIFAIEDFFLTNDDIFPKKKVFINQVVVNEDMGDEVMFDLNSIRKNQWENFYKKGRNDSWFFKKFFFENMQIIFESKGTPTILEKSSFTGTCFPGGQKFFVDINGKILVCERGMEDFPIGNVNDGFDFNTIKHILVKWRKDILKRKCWECGFWYFCSMCFASNKKGKHFNITKIDCTRFKKSTEKRLGRFVEQMEIKDEIYSNHNNSINDFLDSLQPIRY